MSADDIRAAADGGWGYFTDAVKTAQEGPALSDQDKLDLAADWVILRDVLRGADTSSSIILAATRSVFDKALTPWLIQMSAANYPGADGDAPAHMRVSYDMLAPHLGRPLADVVLN